MNQSSIKCFLLNYTSHDFGGKYEIILHAVSSDCKPVKIRVDSFRPLFFVPRSTSAQKTSKAAERKSLKLRGMDGTDVDCLYFNTYASYLDCSKRLRLDGISVYESDVAPVERYLMERFICGGFEATGVLQTVNNRYELRNPLLHGIDHTPQLKTISLDIETNAATDQIYSIALYGEEERVFIIGPGIDVKPVTYCSNEKELLCRFFNYLSDCDPDIIIGWSIVDFDLRVIQDRCNIHSVPFSLGREAGARIVPSRNNNQMVARIPGRVIMDVPLMLRSYYHTFEEYSLNFVASEMLGKSKTIELTDQDKINEINRLFIEDKKKSCNL